MAQYISKSVVLDELKRKRDAALIRQRNLKAIGQESVINEMVANELNKIISSINHLEVKEVDLEKELDSMITPELKFHKALPSLFDVAKHFFELGLFSQLTWKDIKRISEIGEDFMNSEDSDNLNDEEYYTEILNRFKAQKGKEV